MQARAQGSHRAKRGSSAPHHRTNMINYLNLPRYERTAPRIGAVFLLVCEIIVASMDNAILVGVAPASCNHAATTTLVQQATGQAL